MRHLAISLTIFGILLHALLGWCTQHGHGGCTQTACRHPVPKHAAAANHAHCHGHCHAQPDASHDQSDDQDHTPADSKHIPCCDHADCLFIDGSAAGQKIEVPALSQLQFALVELTSLQSSQQSTGTTHPLFEPPPQAQAARVARCVWLI